MYIYMCVIYDIFVNVYICIYIHINFIERVLRVFIMIDTASFMLGNLQSIFLPTKTKRFNK